MILHPSRMVQERTVTELRTNGVRVGGQLVTRRTLRDLPVFDGMRDSKMISGGAARGPEVKGKLPGI